MHGNIKKTNFEKMFTFTLVDHNDCHTKRNFYENGKEMKEWKDFIKNDIEKFEVKFEAICDYDGEIGERSLTHKKGDIIQLRPDFVYLSTSGDKTSGRSK